MNYFYAKKMIWEFGTSKIKSTRKFDSLKLSKFNASDYPDSFATDILALPPL